MPPNGLRIHPPRAFKKPTISARVSNFLIFRRGRESPTLPTPQRNLLNLFQASRLLFSRKAFALVDTGKRGHSQPRLCRESVKKLRNDPLRESHFLNAYFLNSGGGCNFGCVFCWFEIGVILESPGCRSEVCCKF